VFVRFDEYWSFTHEILNIFLDFPFT